MQTHGSGLTYIRGLIELDYLDAEEISLLSLYESVLTRIGRGGFDYRSIFQRFVCAFFSK